VKIYGFAVLAAALALSACQQEPPPGKFKKWGRVPGYGASTAAEKSEPKEEASAVPPSTEEMSAEAEEKKAEAGEKTAAAEEAETKTQEATAAAETTEGATDGAAETATDAATASKAEAKAEDAADAADTATATADAAAAAEGAEGAAEASDEAAEASGEAAEVASAAGYDEAKFEKGKKVFGIHCVACHQMNGQGLPGAFPPLVGSDWVLGDPRRPAAIVIRGLMGEIEVKGQKWNNVMAPLGQTLDDAEIAAALTYVRNAWGNSASGVDSELVSGVREALEGKSGMWQGGDAVNAFVEGLE
jgi:mono/diheme cytochrome c family protein